MLPQGTRTSNQLLARCVVCQTKMSISPKKLTIPKHKKKGSQDYCPGAGVPASRTWTTETKITSKQVRKTANERPAVLPQPMLSGAEMGSALKRAKTSAQKRKKYTGRGRDGWPLSTSVRAVPTSPPGTGKRS